jgi:DNA-binding Lrp family transcriptional regulator
MYKLDDTDAKILQALQTNGRIPLTQLSTQLNVPHGTLRDRIRKMEKTGVIERYTAVINPAKVGCNINCYVELTLDHQVDTSKAIKALMKMEEVTEIHTLTGEIDALVRIWARDIEHLRQILYDKFAAMPGMVHTNTVVVLSTQIKPLPLLMQGEENGR